MNARRILPTLLLMALASANAWGVITVTSSAPTSPVLIGQSYSFQITSTPVATWAVTTGLLPTGMSLSTGGLLSASQLTATGTYSFTVTATSGVETPLAVPITIQVNNGPVTVNKSSFNPNAAVGVAYSQQLTALGGTPPYSWTLAPGNNNGMSLSSTGLLTGTPVSAGSVPLSVSVSDSSTPTPTFGSVTLTLNVTGAFTITTTTLPGGVVGTAYSQTLAASGGAGGLTWALASGSNPLPPGLAISANGVISGTPTTNGSYPFTVAVTDSNSITVTKQLTIAIGPTLTITTTTLPNATVGVAYSQTFQATSGTGTLTWSATGLPSTLTMSAAGVLSGTPTTAATITFSVTVTDSANATATANMTLTVLVAVFRVTTVSPLPSGTVGVPYTQTLQTTGGTAPLNWSSFGLPVGFSIDAATGVISGTPTTSGPTNFSVTVTDSANLTATASFLVTITQPTLTITDVTASCFVNAAYAGRRFPETERTLPAGCSANYQFTVSGGTAPYTWSAVGLPTGVTLNTSTGVLSGAFPAAGTISFTVVATDVTQQRGVLPTSVTVLALPQIASHDIIVSGKVAPDTLTAGQQPAVVVSIGGTVPFTVRGTMTLSFASSVGGDDQLVRFSNGTRTANFTVSPTSGGRATFSDGNLAVLTGTTAGTITLTATFSDTSTPANDMTPKPDKTFTYTITAGSPVITRVTITSTQACTAPTCFLVSVTGYSTARDMTSALFTFTPTTGTTLGSNTATVQLGAAFTTWYQTTASNAFGTQFTFTIPFAVSSTGTISGAPIASLTVSLTNSKGTSTTSNPVNP